MVDFVGISLFLRIALWVAMETMHFYTFARLKIDQTLVFKRSGCYSGRGYGWKLCYSPTTYDHFFYGWSLYYKQREIEVTLKFRVYTVNCENHSNNLFVKVKKKDHPCYFCIILQQELFIICNCYMYWKIMFY